MSWLDEIVEQHSELESPTSFWRWAALSAVSAIVKDHVWLDRQIFKSYPNIYVMLHAESGMKKGPPVAMAGRLVRFADARTKIYEGRSSIQGILKDLGTATTIPGGKIEASSTAFICSSELSSSIVEDKVATQVLTDLYDRQYRQDQWRSLLKMETFTLNNPTITMLTATNEAMSGDFFTNSAIQGGFFARTFIIFEKERNRANSLIYPLENPPDYKTSAEYLKELAKLHGEFIPLAVNEEIEGFNHKRIKLTSKGNARTIWFSEVGAIYDDWYENFTESIKEQEIKDDTGTLNRFGDSVLKVAMLLSLAEHPKLIITRTSMIEAISQCEKLVGNVRRTTYGRHGIDESAVLKTELIKEFLDRETHSASRTVLMKKFWMHYSTTDQV
jgi:hypothetical protein